MSGSWGINISGNASSAYFLPTKYDGGDRPNPQSYFTEYTGIRVAMTRSTWLGAWNDTLWINGYSGADVPYMVAIHTIRNGQPRMWLSSQSNKATDYGTPYEVITDYNAASKVLRKGNDTNGGTYQLYSTNASGGYSSRAIELREVNTVGNGVIAPEYAPAIGFHWMNVAASKLMLRNDGQLAVSEGSSDWGNPLIHSGNIGSQSVNYANSAGSAPNATNQNPSYLVTPGDGNGIKFWGADNYKISMGVGSLYQYGPVTDYSIKMQMNSGSPGRGFTWGREGNAPIAALNATSGNFQTAGNMAASAFFQFSDIRLKTVIPHQHVSVESVGPITYLWKDPKKRDSPQVGYSAQEVQKVMPYAVSVADDGMLSVNYIQVLVAKVAELEFKLKKHGLE